MKIAFMHYHLKTGGVTTVIKQQLEALDQHCLDSGLARFKRPWAYAFVREIPRSASGKLLRRHLRAGDYELLDEPKSTL